MTKFKVGDICVDNTQREEFYIFEIIDIQDGYYTYISRCPSKTLSPNRLKYEFFENNGTRKLTKLELALT